MWFLSLYSQSLKFLLHSQVRTILKCKSDNATPLHGFSSLLKSQVVTKAPRALHGLAPFSTASSRTALPFGHTPPDLPADLPSKHFPNSGPWPLLSLCLECSSPNICMVGSLPSSGSLVKCHLIRGVFYVHPNKTVLHPYLLDFSP